MREPQICKLNGMSIKKKLVYVENYSIFFHSSAVRNLQLVQRTSQSSLARPINRRIFIFVHHKKTSESKFFCELRYEPASDIYITPRSNMAYRKHIIYLFIKGANVGKWFALSYGHKSNIYLSANMEDLLIHGDSVYDIIDKADHAAVQAELVRGSQAAAAAAAATTSTTPPEALDGDRLFLCRMNVSRNARRQMRFGDQKVVLVQGKYLSYLPLCSRNEPVFLARCTPVAMPETRECVVQGATNVFTSVHTLDMKFINLDKNGEFYLGYSRSSLAGVSWYHLIHPENMKEAQTKHRLITASEQDRSCILLLRLQVAGGTWRWVHCVLQVKDASDSSGQQSTATQQPGTSQAQQTPPAQQQPVIVATNQVLSEREAQVLRGNSWLYHYYTMQSKLQYGLAYETHAQRVAAYYPQVMGYQNDPASTYMTQASLNGGHSYTHNHAHSGHSAYSLGTPSAYAAHLQHYHHHYSVRLQHGLDYGREPAWGTYDTSHAAATNHAAATHIASTHTAAATAAPNYTTLQPTHIVQPHTPSPKSLKRPASSPTSPRRSASNSPRQPTGTPMSMHSTGDSGGVALATPVAVRATPFGIHKGTSSPELDHLDTSWKHSPTQEVPEYPEYSPFITPPYSAATPTKHHVFNFDTPDPRDTLGHDQQVPSVDTHDFSSWAANSFGKSWLPILNDTTTPLRALHHTTI
ncbi:unnamed protein product, partial [Meganyctiphanes norvegica]